MSEKIKVFVTAIAVSSFIFGSILSEYGCKGRISFYGMFENKMVLAEELYKRAEYYDEHEKYSAAVLLYEQIIEEYPETVYANLAASGKRVSESEWRLRKIRSDRMEKVMYGN